MPTLKQKMVAKKILENPGMAVSAAMRECGYSKSSCNKPTELTKSEGWAELMEEYLPDRNLISVHAEGLKAVKTEAGAKEPDFAVRHKYLETAYKLKGKLSDAVVDQRTQIIQIELTDETDTKSSTIKNLQGQAQISDSSGRPAVREDNISLSEDDFGSGK